LTEVRVKYEHSISVTNKPVVEREYIVYDHHEQGRCQLPGGQCMKPTNNLQLTVPKTIVNSVTDDNFIA